MQNSDCCQFSDIHILQGSVATYLRCGEYLNMSLLQIYQWVCQWKNFKNWLTFGEVMGKSLVSCFFETQCIYNNNNHYTGQPQKLTDFNGFGTLNPQRIWHENLTDMSISPVRCSHFTLGNPKVIFNSIIHTYFWLFMLSQKKTNCNPLAHPTWKCHHTNLWIAKLFPLTEALLRSFKHWKLGKEPVVGCRRWLWIEPAVMCGNWNVRQAMSQQVFRVTTFYINTCFQSFSIMISRTVHHTVLKFSPCCNKLLP